MLDKIYKLLMIVGLTIGLGMWAQRASSGTAMEARMVAVERQTAETAIVTRETAALLKETVALLRSHEVEDAAITQTVMRNTEIINAMMRGAK